MNDGLHRPEGAFSVGRAPAPPERASGRDDLADELRGLALLGSVMVNAPFIAISSAGLTDAALATPLDRAVAFAVVAFAQAKFYLVFSFLFGYSLCYLLKDGTAAAQRAYRRRLAGLAVLGLAHAACLFVGDILLIYALLGSVLLGLSARSDRAVWIVAATSAALWLLGLLALTVMGAADTQGQLEWQAQTAAVDRLLAEGSFWESVRARVQLWPSAQAVILWLNGFAVLAMFCVGMMAGRRRCLSEPARHRRLWRWGLALGLAVGLPGALWSAYGMVGPGVSLDAPGAPQFVALAIGFATAPALSAAYVGGCALLHLRWPGLLRGFRPAGRMSLTGYLGESALLAIVFGGFGLGLMGQLGAAAVTAVAVAVWLVLDGFAHLWQRRFRYGPLEYLLRRWSLGS